MIPSNQVPGAWTMVRAFKDHVSIFDYHYLTLNQQLDKFCLKYPKYANYRSIIKELVEGERKKQTSHFIAKEVKK